MENQQVFLTQSFEKYSDEQKQKYKIFMTNILRLGRETIKQKNEELNFIIADKNLVKNTFQYSIANKKWIKNNEQFNPTAITGIMLLLEDYSFDGLKYLTNNYK